MGLQLLAAEIIANAYKGVSIIVRDKFQYFVGRSWDQYEDREIPDKGAIAEAIAAGGGSYTPPDPMETKVVSGTTVSDGIYTIQYDQDVYGFRPTVIVVNPGVNDGLFAEPHQIADTNYQYFQNYIRVFLPNNGLVTLDDNIIYIKA